MGLSKQAWISENAEHAAAAVEKLTDQFYIARAALEAWRPSTRLLAVYKLDDQFALAQVVNNETFTEIIEAAFHKLKSPDALANVAKWCKYKKWREAALEKVTEPDLLEEIMIYAHTDEISARAAQRLGDQELADSIYLKAARSDKYPVQLRLRAIEQLIGHPLEVSALFSTVHFCGSTLRQSKDEAHRKQAAKVLLALYKTYKREDARRYNGAFITRERVGHSDYPGYHTDYEDSTLSYGNHSDYRVHTDETSYRDIHFDIEEG